MDKYINLYIQTRIKEIYLELFTMANKYVGDEYGHIACRLHHIHNGLMDIEELMKTTASLN